MPVNTEFREDVQTPVLPPRGDGAKSLRSTVAAIIVDCATPEEAEEKALAEVEADEALAAEAMRLGLRQIIGEARSKLRAEMVRGRRAEWTAAKNAPKGFAAAAVVRQSFFNWPLPNSGVVLGDATVADLEDAAAFHDTHRDAHAHRGAAYRQIAAILSTSRRNATVRTVIAEAELGRILAGTPS
jgi:hypothetical protein